MTPPALPDRFSKRNSVSVIRCLQVAPPKGQVLDIASTLEPVMSTAKEIVMASEDFRRPGEASWSVDEIRYDEIERDRIKEDTQLLYLLTSASFIEITSALYTRNLVEFFSEDRETVQWLGECWGPEELQHGAALKRYVHAAWPNFAWGGAYQSFFSE